MNERTIALIGKESFEKLQKSRVLIAGLGGVGGYIAEGLARAGVGCIGLCDFDIVDESNINRQILALNSTVGKKKTSAAAARIADINPDCRTIEFDIKLDADNMAVLDIISWDFVADAIDDVPAKLSLIEKYKDRIISCMGTGNKLDPFGFTIAPIEKTEGDPLARSIRKSLREKGISKIPVLYSKEMPVSDEKKPIPTISYMPAVAGLEISSYIIKKLLA